MLLNSFPAKEAGDATAALKVSAYVMAVEDLPGWAIERAVKRYIVDGIGKSEFAPNPPNFRQAVIDVTMAVKGRAAWLRSLAKMPVAKTTTAEERAATIARLSAILKPLSTSKTEGA